MNLISRKLAVSTAVIVAAVSVVIIAIGLAIPSLSHTLQAFTLGTRESQNGYRFSANADSLTPGLASAAANTPVTLAATGDQFRLRLTVRASGGTAALSDQDMKLQFAERVGACDTAFAGETYEDVTTTSDISYFNNPSVADNTNVALVAGNDPNPPGTEFPQTYNEANPFTNSQSTITATNSGLWDFSLFDNGATGGATYCLRAINDDGSEFSDDDVVGPYQFIPEVTMAAGGGGGGGGGASCPFASGTFQVNGGAQTTTSRTLSITTETTNVTQYVISENLSFAGAEFQTLPEGGVIPFELSEGNGQKTINILFRNHCSQTPTFSASIELAVPAAPPAPPACDPLTQDLSPDDGDPAAACIRPGEPGSRTQPRTVLPLGRYVRTIDDTTVYYITPDGRRKPVLDSRTFFTHEDTFGVVEYVTADVIASAPQAHPVLPLHDSVLVTFWDDPAVYVVITNPDDAERPVLRLLDNEALAAAIFGPNWRDNVVDFNTAFHILFAPGLPIFNTADLPAQTSSLRRRDELSARAGMIKIEGHTKRLP